MTAAAAAKLMVGKKNIVILTGAGLSVSGGVPTFRGMDGLWTREYAYAKKPTDICTKKFFKEHPEANWEWHYDFYKMHKDCTHTLGHEAIVEFQEYCHQKTSNSTKPNCMLVTQNIDDFHGQMIKKSKILNQRPKNMPIAFTPHLHEIHGNIFYMHCTQEDQAHAKTHFPAPKLEDVPDTKNFVPKCTYPGCGANMKPNCMFFDEEYSEHYYRLDTVTKYVNKADLCIVIGTQLGTEFSKRICHTLLNVDFPVIEINLESALPDDGFVNFVEEKSEIAVPELFKEFYKLVKK